MGWKKYTASMLLSNFIMLLVIYSIFRLQKYLPLNPDGIANMSVPLPFIGSIVYYEYELAKLSGENTLSDYRRC